MRGPSARTAVRDELLRRERAQLARLEEARALARVKQLFRMVDKDGSGSITKGELYTALRRYKVNITKR